MGRQITTDTLWKGFFMGSLGGSLYTLRDLQLPSLNKPVPTEASNSCPCVIQWNLMCFVLLLPICLLRWPVRTIRGCIYC